MGVERPNFATASVDDMKRYLRDCRSWRDAKGIDDAERELIRRGYRKYVEYHRKHAPK